MGISKNSRRVGMAAAAVAVVGGVWWALSARPSGGEPAAVAPASAPPFTPATSAAAPGPAPPAAPAPALASAPSGKTFPNEPGPSPDAPKPTTGYRPATWLRLSSGEPAKSSAGDASHPTLLRIFEVTGADSAQQAQLRGLWKVHEDGRRALFATAYPRVSGPRMLDRDELRKLDAALRAGCGGVLRVDQQEKLLAELPPSSQEPQTQETWDKAKQP